MKVLRSERGGNSQGKFLDDDNTGSLDDGSFDETKGDLFSSEGGPDDVSGTFNSWEEGEGPVQGQDAKGNNLPASKREKTSIGGMTQQTSMNSSEAQWQSRSKASPEDLVAAGQYRHFSGKDWDLLHSYEAFNYHPPNSKVYRRWLKRQPHTSEFHAWVMMGVIGSVIGIIAFFLHNLITLISYYKWQLHRLLLRDYDNFTTLGYMLVFGYAFMIPSTFLVVFIQPAAASSGVPELIAFLNGTIVRKIFTLRTLFVKFTSCAFAVAAGMPCGPEGPMIHIGGLIGGRLSSIQLKRLKIPMTIFSRFRNSVDQRNFISAGSAAGIAAAFSAPIGGLLFAFEEVSSYWSVRLSWQTLFCCMTAFFTTSLFNSSFHMFEYYGSFGIFSKTETVVFAVEHTISTNIIATIPCVLLGFIGGSLGSVYTLFILKTNRLRKLVWSSIRVTWAKKLVKMAEPLLIYSIVTVFVVFAPIMFGCEDIKKFTGDRGACYTTPKSRLCQMSNFSSDFQFSLGKEMRHYKCNYTKEEYHQEGERRGYKIEGQYHQLASLIHVSGHETVKTLMLRRTPKQFDYLPLFLYLCVYFTTSFLTVGSQISAGMVIPILTVGALYGRLFGLLITDTHEAIMGNAKVDDYWEWVDPGVLSMLGAVSFFAGVTRLTMSLAVIMLEMTNDIESLIMIMITTMSAKWIGDFITHPLYHAIMDMKCVPFLSKDTQFSLDGHGVHLELYDAGQIMNEPVMVVNTISEVRYVAKLLRRTKHNGFPVVIRHGKYNKGKFKGLITATELTILLLSFYEDHLTTAFPVSYGKPKQYIYKPNTAFPEINSHWNRKMKKPKLIAFVLRKLSELEGFKMDLTNYVDTSAMRVSAKFSLQRTYNLFFGLGIRHLTVVDDSNIVQGIITRKDLMGYNLERRILRGEPAKQFHLWKPKPSKAESASRKARKRNGTADIRTIDSEKFD